MALETYSPLQLEAAELVTQRGTDLAQANRFGALINTSNATTLPILLDAAHYLGAEIVGLTPNRTNRAETLSQQELEALRVLYGTIDKHFTMALVYGRRGCYEEATQKNHVVARLGKNTTRLAISVLNNDRQLIISN